MRRSKAGTHCWSGFHTARQLTSSPPAAAPRPSPLAQPSRRIACPTCRAPVRVADLLYIDARVASPHKVRAVCRMRLCPASSMVAIVTARRTVWSAAAAWAAVPVPPWRPLCLLRCYLPTTPVRPAAVAPQGGGGGSSAAGSGEEEDSISVQGSYGSKVRMYACILR